MPRRLVIEADGGSRGNPGVAGYGALVRDPESGVLLAQRAAPLGKESNNVAEYSGLIAGLQAVLDLSLEGDADIQVLMDSKLVVEQMAGRWKIKHADMRRLAMEARDLVRQIEWAGGTVAYEWIPRARNGAADALSNQGMDGEHVHYDAQAGASPDAETGGEGTSHAPAFGDVRTSDTVAAQAMRMGPPSMGQPVRMLLVRHGVTDFTLASKLDGRGGSDPHLHERGRAQAQAAAGAVRRYIDTVGGLSEGDPAPHDASRTASSPSATVIISSLRRARQTGAAIAEALGVHAEVDADWDEQSFGDWDGRSMPDLAESAYDDLRLLRADVDYARPGGESHRELAQRVTRAWARAIEVGGTVVVASHRKPLMCVLSHILGIDHERIWSIATAPCSLTAIDVWPDGGVSVAFVNDTHHLRDIDEVG
ncbi:MAG: bifunctional RNase H/acid phosphatase [Ornithinimicrobium sp.]